MNVSLTVMGVLFILGGTIYLFIYFKKSMHFGKLIRIIHLFLREDPCL